jgi:hypothetical protein
MTTRTATQTCFADLRWHVAAPSVIYLPARLHNYPQLESPDLRAARIRATRRRASQRELNRFLADLDGELILRAGVKYEVALNPRYGRYTIRIPDSRSVLVIKADHTGLTFYPQPEYDQNRRAYGRRKWQRHFAAFPDRDEFFLLLEQRIARHNAQGGHYNN